VIAGLLLGLAVLLAMLWRCDGNEHAAHSTRAVKAARGSARVVDVKTLPRGTITAVVLDERRQPIAGARVCADGDNAALDLELLRDAPCTTSDARGNVTLANLLPAAYRVGASAPGFQPGVESARVDGASVRVELVLRGGGVEITGVVLDVTGGPIASARVSSNGAFAETDAKGEFSLWTSRRARDLLARADGYADRLTWVDPPGRVRILMTPEATLSGVVIDAASGEPVEGARVSVRILLHPGFLNPETGDAITDARGAFTARRLMPGRYATIARTEHGYGRSESSTQLGIGERGEGLVVKLHPAVRLDGEVRFASSSERCAVASVTLSDRTKAQQRTLDRAPDGALWADGVLAGTYAVRVQCEGSLLKDEYPPLVVADRDIGGLVWEVERGATIEGRVTFTSGQPIAGAVISAFTADHAGGNATSNANGSYRITGLRPGHYNLRATSDEAKRFEDTEIDVIANAVAKRDLVLEPRPDTRLEGIVVDAKGNAVPRTDVEVQKVDDESSTAQARTDMNGAFWISGLSPGDYWVHDPWTHRNRTTVRVGETARVKIVTDPPSGQIHGVVVDHRGKPVSDAYIVIDAEDDTQQEQPNFFRSLSEPDPVITNVQGAFTVNGLRDDSKYSVLAYRKGGAEGTAMHVRVGDRISIRLDPIGALQGRVQRAGKAVNDFEIAVVEVREPDPLGTAFSQRERFFRTNGHFKMEGLPKRRYRVTASAEGSQAAVDIDLGIGEVKTLDFELDAPIVLTGRVLDHPSGKPVAGLRMHASRDKGSSSFMRNEATTDADGRFTIPEAPRGTVSISGYGVGADFAFVQAVRTVDGPGPVDVGTLYRVKSTFGPDAVGLGFEVKTIDPDTPADQRKLVVDKIDPKGPAAATDLRVGDVVTSLDDLDLRGGNSALFMFLGSSAPGTKTRITVERGVTIEIQR
jgi:protocatechuate 3,4-dioxygenase beta subunit